MGHRKKHAPRRGSLAYAPRARAHSLVPRLRYWPQISEKKLLGFAGYKAGMTYSYIIEEDKRSPNYGKEVFCPLTIIETPPVTVCALRAYEEVDGQIRTFNETWSHSLPKDLPRAIGARKGTPPDLALKSIEENLGRLHDIRVVVCTNPKEGGIHKKKPEVMEVPVGGASVEDKFQYASQLLGKDVNLTDTFEEGDYVDVAAVTKGKGFQGPVKRFGVRILQNKSRKTVRGVGSIGPWHPKLVMWTVPRAGQMGFAQRVEHNKLIMKIGQKGEKINFKGGLHRYGIIRGSYILLKGSVPGPAKRLVRLREASRGPGKAPPSRVTFIHT